MRWHCILLKILLTIIDDWLLYNYYLPNKRIRKIHLLTHIWELNLGTGSWRKRNILSRALFSQLQEVVVLFKLKKKMSPKMALPGFRKLPPC